MNTEATLDIRAFHAIVDKDLPQPHQINYEVTRDSIRTFAYAVDDHNALYLDDDYASRMGWGHRIAPPGYLASHGSSVWLAQHVPTIEDADGNKLTEIVHASEMWRFLRPVRPGDHVLSHSKISRAQAKFGRKVGASVMVDLHTRYFNHKGEDVATRVDTCFVLKEGKGGADSAAGYPPLENGKSRSVIQPTRFPGTFELPSPHEYTQRYFEDVAIGDPVDTLKIPPVMLQNLGRYCAATLASGVDEVGGPSPNGAMPDAYVFGHLRVPWFGRMLTAWAGPRAWIRSLEQRDKSWLLIGFAVECRGRITGKSGSPSDPWITVELECVNELGHVTNTGSADLTLPTREPRA
ncbi:MaoC family dehydratase N-terminal domain-containing protein [Hydrogenophaga sp.]|uniref:FAS1-like dehydratase domain-containing protein n=1 Tax=Hydrogenophaga sp. TaxID=1904254 RepID=UPI00261A42DE|nr:MaoC family dehydratase N-terminal domain-containing protein [Hydrogenophaga sp.]MCW5653589.1 MaoC family dehydratase N-terminal domain-containing protein [Hydrogenophaga sp.]